MGKRSNHDDFKSRNIEKTIPEEYLAVYNVIANAEGSITKDEILLQLGQDEKYTRKLHTIIRALVVDYRLPIGSSSKKEIKGYFIFKTGGQGRDALRSLISRRDDVNKRISVVMEQIREIEEAQAKHE